MKHLLIAFLLACSVANVYAQQHQELVDLYYKHEYNLIVRIANDYLSKNDEDSSAYEMKGEALFDLRNYDSSLFAEQKALKYDQEKTLVSCWAHMYMGRDYFMKGNKKLAEEELDSSISAHATENMVAFSNFQLRVFGFADFYYDWKTVESEHLIFHFQITADTPNIQQYVALHEETYTLINNTFHASLPKKIEYFVWSDSKDIQKIDKAGIIIPAGWLVCHVSCKDQNRGYELARLLSYWSWNTLPVKTNRFITEGIATAFDCEDKDRYETARQTINNLSISSVVDTWQDSSNRFAERWLGRSEKGLAPLAGAFVYYLSQHSSTEQFKNIVKNQTFENAQIVYGKKLDEMITDFNSLVGIK